MYNFSLPSSQMLITFLQKIIIFFLCFLLVAAIVQIGVTYHLSGPGREVTPTELIVVFPGDKDRVEAGCKLTATGYGRKIMIISQPADKTSEICIKHDGPGSAKTVKAISGGKSRSTFEDVYNTVAAIEKHKVRSVTLVTSAYHLPRAAFLLKVTLAIKGYKVALQLHPVVNEWLLSNKLQLHYNEFAKLIGSSAEMTGYFLTGKLLLDSPWFRGVQTFLKKHLLLTL